MITQIFDLVHARRHGRKAHSFAVRNARYHACSHGASVGQLCSVPYRGAAGGRQASKGVSVIQCHQQTALAVGKDGAETARSCVCAPVLLAAA